MERNRREEMELDLSALRQKKELLKSQLQFSDIENYQKIEEQIRQTMAKKDDLLKSLQNQLALEKVRSEKLEELLENQRLKLLEL
jgi:hypothetical protein